jgi:hypothetical protein
MKGAYLSGRTGGGAGRTQLSHIAMSPWLRWVVARVCEAVRIVARRSAPCIAFALGLACGPVGAAAPQIGLLTSLEGKAQLLRGVEVFSAAEGLALRHGDVIETGDSSFAQLEFSANLVIALGPGTRLFLFDLPTLPAQATRPQFVLLRGWVKVESAPKEPREVLLLASRDLSLTGGLTALVMHVKPSTTRVFVESGSAFVTLTKTPPRSINVAAGQFAQQTTNLPIDILRGPAPDFLVEMPRAFRDTLPPMIDRRSWPAVLPTRLRFVSYEDVEDLLTLPGQWRGRSVQRFGSRTKDEAFRAGLNANLRRHPEWDRVLHPEKYVQPDETGQATRQFSANGGKPQ